MRVFVICPRRLSECETFVQSHVRGLPDVVCVAHGSRAHLSDVDDRCLESWRYRLARLLQRGRSSRTTSLYRRALQETRADVVLAQFGPCGALCIEACNQLRIPLVVNFRGADIYADEYLTRHAAAYQTMFRTAGAIIGVSQAMCERLVSLGSPPERTYWNPSGFRADLFEATDAGRNPPVFVSAGRFVEKKSPESTIRAFAAVRSQLPDARLRMIGDGPLLDRCVELVRSLGLGESVAFLGSQPHADVAREMSLARCFVQHSVRAKNGDCEGTPVAVQEAAASGLPVVATRHAGIPDVIHHGVSGLLVEEGDIGGMAEAMRVIGTDSRIATRYGQNARRIALEKFTVEQRVGRLREILQSATQWKPSCA